MAVMEDAPEILAIYEPYIRKTTITFEYEVPTVEAFRQRMAASIGCIPLSGMWNGRKNAAYAYAHRFQERAAYQWNAELSVYVDENCTGMGMGKALYQALIEILKCQNVKNAYALVTSPNEKSDALHKSMGFTLEGVSHNTGYKDGQMAGCIQLCQGNWPTWSTAGGNHPLFCGGRRADCGDFRADTGKTVRNCKTLGYSLGGQPLTFAQALTWKRTLKNSLKISYSPIKRKNKLLCFSAG